MRAPTRIKKQAFVSYLGVVVQVYEVDEPPNNKRERENNPRVPGARQGSPDPNEYSAKESTNGVLHFA